MHCYICDRLLKDDEIQLNRDHGDFDPCGVCLDVIQNVFEPLSEEEVTHLLAEEWPEEFAERQEESS